MQNKKAWIRIAEAAIAIMLLASVILVLITKQAVPKDVAETMYALQHTILDEASKNESVRNAVLAENLPIIKSFISERLPAGFSFNISICAPGCNPGEIGCSGGACDVELPQEEVYVDDIMISSTLQQYQPKKLKFYAWVE